MPRYLTASHPDFPEIDHLQRLLCVAVNAHMHTLKPLTVDERAEIDAAADDIWIELAERLAGGVWADFINVRFEE